MVRPDFDSLENEAENFFADINEEEREETRAFLSASLRSFSKADETDHENHGV